MKIIAKGNRNGVELIIEVDNGVISVDGDEEKAIEYYGALTTPRTVAGTFWPEPEGMMNIHTNLMFYFFDSTPEVITIGEFDEEIPYLEDDEHIIY